MLQEGFELMLIGMGVVFAFLVLLVVFMSLSGAFFTRFSDRFTEPKAPTPAPARPKQPASPSAKLAVALAAAYRARRGS